MKEEQKVVSGLDPTRMVWVQGLLATLIIGAILGAAAKHWIGEYQQERKEEIAEVSSGAAKLQGKSIAVRKTSSFPHPAYMVVYNVKVVSSRLIELSGDELEVILPGSLVSVSAISGYPFRYIITYKNSEGWITETIKTDDLKADLGYPKFPMADYPIKFEKIKWVFGLPEEE